MVVIFREGKEGKEKQSLLMVVQEKGQRAEGLGVTPALPPRPCEDRKVMVII